MLNVRPGTVLQPDPARAPKSTGTLLVVRSFNAREGRAECATLFPGLARGNRAMLVVVGTDSLPWDAVAVVGELRWPSE